MCWWGGPPGPQPTPSSASSHPARCASSNGGTSASRADPGARPTSVSAPLLHRQLEIRLQHQCRAQGLGPTGTSGSGARNRTENWRSAPTGEPFGDADFVAMAGERFGRCWTPGRPIGQVQQNRVIGYCPRFSFGPRFPSPFSRFSVFLVFPRPPFFPSSAGLAAVRTASGAPPCRSAALSCGSTETQLTASAAADPHRRPCRPPASSCSCRNNRSPCRAWRIPTRS